MTPEEEFNFRMEPSLCKACNGHGFYRTEQQERESKGFCWCVCPKGQAILAQAKRNREYFQEREVYPNV